MADTAKPLAGLKVLELARVLAGPWAGQLLADLGADVVKVERAGAGDDTRGWGPPFVAAKDGGSLSAGYFHSTNRGKRSIEADFDSAAGQALVRALASQADILIENFKVGGLAKYGLDFASLHAANPQLIYCSITGFGQTGPYAARAGYDFLIQGLAGVMDLTGSPDGPPMKTGYATADLFCGVYATTGILAALAERHRTGKGAHVDMALLDCQVAVLGYQALNFLISGRPATRIGNSHPTIVPYDVFPTSDGSIILAVGNDGQFARLCQVLGVPELAQREAYRRNAGRVQHRAALMPELCRLTVRFTRDGLAAELERLQVPAGPVNSVADALEDEQVKARGLVVDLPYPAAASGTVPSLRSPIMIDGKPACADDRSPALGEHNEAVRADTAWFPPPDPSGMPAIPPAMKDDR